MTTINPSPSGEGIGVGAVRQLDCLGVRLTRPTPTPPLKRRGYVASPLPRSIQRLRQIGDDVVDMLQPD